MKPQSDKLLSANISACPNYSEENVEKAVNECFVAADRSGFSLANLSGKTVVVKPNLLLPRKPEQITTTHPQILYAVCKRLKSLGARVIVAESGGGPYNAPLLKNLYAKTGTENAALRAGAELNYDISDVTLETSGKVMKSFRIIKPIAEADFVVSIGKMKTHGFTVTSGAVKNLYGVIPGLVKVHLHSQFPNVRDFAAMLVDLCVLVKPALSIIDGVVAMEGQGPSGGQAKKVGVIISSANPFAADLVATHIMGIDPRDVPVMCEAERRGLVPMDIGKIEITGKKLAVHKFALARKLSTIVRFLPGFLKEPVDRLLKPYPIMEDKCVGCGVCAGVCPEKAIKIDNGKAHVDYYKCIRCYCCHEMCPIKAVDMRRMTFTARR